MITEDGKRDTKMKTRQTRQTDLSENETYSDYLKKTTIPLA